MTCDFRFLIVAITLLSSFHAERLHAENVVTLAAGEHPPYIGASLPQNGYVYELVEEVFKRKGYRVKVDFYPWSRAKLLAAQGTVDGIFPAYDDGTSTNDSFVYSHAFPGDTIGLLKRKKLPISYSAEDVKKQDVLLHSLKNYQFGMVRGGVSLPAFDAANFLTKEMVGDDVQNLDKLALDRIQFTLIDKYTAADLMVGQRPHLIGQLEFMYPPLAERDFFVAFSKKSEKHQQLVAVFNDGLAAVTRDGTLAKIREKHGLFLQKKATANKVRLTIGTVSNNDMLIMQGLSKTFEAQHPNIVLEWRVFDENTLRLRLLSDFAVADGQFDVMTIGAYETPIWAKQGWITPLNDLPDSYDVKDILPTVRTGLSYGGQLFALPFYAESSMTFYRKDLFAKAGIQMPAQPRYDDIMKFASQIHNPSAGVYGICLRGKAGWGENMAFLTTLVNTHGGRWFDEKWHPELDSPAWERAISFYRDILTKYGPPHPEQNGFQENLALFSEGHCGMWIDATVAAGMLFDPKRSRISANLGYVSAPVLASDKGAAWLWSWALAIPHSSRHKKEAVEFISWATSKGYIQSVAKKYGWVAVPPGTRTSTYQSESYVKEAPFSQFVLKAIESADINNSTVKPKPYIGIQYVGIPEFPAIGSQVGNEIAKALSGEQSVKKALEKSQAIAKQQMKNSGYSKQ